ncbi:MAG: exodeoxyribonuclease I [Candidatus Saccharibacteria bacterium]|nr:exodeoxyribonuclease I [Candidatus Saccharibacteria bacterium]
MAQTFFFYDLETSGLNARQDRIMQFAGQRTDMQLRPIGDPVNLLVQLNDDTLPSPGALMVTGISPQKTIEEGYTEAEFARIVTEELFTPDTIIVGFNSVRFDDEFMRHLLWRNFHDPYEWAWKDGRSRWDMLDVVRMTRALRPEGIEWPVDDNGEPTNRLELITKANDISHENAHDALSDVNALIAVAKLIQDKQPQLFAYLLKMRDKKAVQALVNVEDKKPFVYTSGRYDKEFAKTTVAFPLSTAPHGNVLVYDLRHDPAPFLELSVDELAARLFASWEERQAEDFQPVPVKQLQYNRCPAVAPVGVLEQADGWEKIGLDAATVKKHQNILLAHPDFAERLRTAFEGRAGFASSTDPEAQLYDSFVPDGDKVRIAAVRSADAKALADFHPEFQDERLPGLLLHYKARNFPRSLTESELAEWEAWRTERLKGQLPGFVQALRTLAEQGADEFMLQELQLWLERVMPDGIA